MIYPTLDIELSLWNSGYSYVCGIDEVGRGCFAGPVVVGAVIFPKGCELLTGVADSKLLKAKVREELDLEIKKAAACWAVAEVGVNVINSVGIGKATQMAFRKVVRLLNLRPDFILMDAFYIQHMSKKIQKPIVKGDRLCASISAASIIAKVYRDKLMKDFDKKYPEYGFGKHKGYGTKEHREVIKRLGLSELHRTSFDLEKFLSF